MAAHNWFIDMREHSHGGPVGTLKITDGAGMLYETKDLVSAIAGRDVLVMAHGYNVNRPHGTASLNQWKSTLDVSANTLFIGVLWPGDCILPIFIDYIWEGGEANKSGTMLGAFVDANFGGAASVSFASHSLGARVVLKALTQLKAIASVRQLILMAGAIEDDCLTAEFAAQADLVKHISVVYSLEDHVLQLAYPPGNLLGSFVDHESHNVKSALGRSGPVQMRPNIWGNPMLPVAWKYGHTDYLTLKDIGQMFPQPLAAWDPDDPTGYPAQTPAPDQAKDDWKPSFSAAFASERLNKSS